MVKVVKYVEDFDDDDWENIAKIIPTKDAKKCVKRWLFIQKKGGNKSKWQDGEDEVLKEQVAIYGAKDWT